MRQNAEKQRKTQKHYNSTEGLAACAVTKTTDHNGNMLNSLTICGFS